MAVIVQPNDILQAIIWQKLFNQTLMNTMIYQCINTGTGGPLSLVELATDMQAHIYGAATVGNWAHNMLLCQGIDVQHEKFTLQVIAPQRLRSVPNLVGLVGLGQTTSESSNLGCTITKYTDFAQRSGVGSFHLGAIPINANAMGSVTSGYQPKLAALAEQLAETLTLGVRQAILVPGLINVRNQSSAFKPLTECIPQTTMRTNRQRTVGHGI
jgi:hypothetical protein